MDRDRIEINVGATTMIKQNERRKFVRRTWEDIYQYISNSNMQNLDKPTVLGYFENKTVGYNSDGVLQKAFQCPSRKILT